MVEALDYMDWDAVHVPCQGVAAQIPDNHYVDEDHFINVYFEQRCSGREVFLDDFSEYIGEVRADPELAYEILSSKEHREVVTALLVNKGEKIPKNEVARLVGYVPEDRVFGALEEAGVLDVDKSGAVDSYRILEDSDAYWWGAIESKATDLVDEPSTAEAMLEGKFLRRFGTESKDW